MFAGCVWFACVMWLLVSDVFRNTKAALVLVFIGVGVAGGAVPE